MLDLRASNVAVITLGTLGLCLTNPGLAGNCSVSNGVADPKLLRASHIKPWAVSDNRERLDPYNGLLLAPHVDVLFDRGFLSFEADGTVVVSGKLDRAVLEAWGLGTPKRGKPFSAAQGKYLKYHRAVVFRR